MLITSLVTGYYFVSEPVRMNVIGVAFPCKVAKNYLKLQYYSFAVLLYNLQSCVFQQ